MSTAKKSSGITVGKDRGRSGCNLQSNDRKKKKRQSVSIDWATVVNIQNNFKYNGDMETMDYPSLNEIAECLWRMSHE